MIITVCGTLKFFNQMIELAKRLTGEGNIVLLPFSYRGY